MASNMFKLGVPTLEQISLAKVTTTLIKTNSIYQVITKNARANSHRKPHDVQLETEELLNEIIIALNIPKCLKTLLHSFLIVTMQEIDKWMQFLTHSSVFDFDKSWLFKSIDYLQWTPHGEIDRTKSARKLISLDMELRINERYKIACAFYLEDEVRNIWSDLQLYLEMEHNLNPPTGHELFWTQMMSSRNHTFDKNVKLAAAVGKNNLNEVKYVWSLMTDEEKNLNIIICLNYFNKSEVNDSAILLFLFSQLNEQQLDEFLLTSCADSFKFCALQIFISNSLYVDIFVSIVKWFGYSFIKHKNEILRSLAEHVDRFNGYKCKETFIYLWKKFSLYDEESIIVSNKYYIQQFFKIQDLVLLELVLCHVSMESRRWKLTALLKFPHRIDLIFLIKAAQKLLLDDVEMNIFKQKCAHDVITICRKYFSYSRFSNPLKTDIEFVNKCEMLDYFIQFTIAPEQNLTQFKRGLILNRCIVYDLMINILRKHESQLDLIDQCLRWCELTQDEITEFKRNLIHECKHVLECISCELLEKHKHDFSDKLLNWCLLTPDEIVEFKTKRLVNSHHILRLFSFTGKNIGIFNYFLSWCFSDPVKRNRFKREYLFKILRLDYFKFVELDAIAALLQFCNYDSKKFRNWYAHVNWGWSDRNTRLNVNDFLTQILNLYYSKERIDRLKHDIFVSDFGMNLCIDYCAHAYGSFLESSSGKESIFTTDFSVECNLEFINKFSAKGINCELKKYLVWLNPSLESINELKRKVESEELPRLRHCLKFVFFDFLEKAYNEMNRNEHVINE